MMQAKINACVSACMRHKLLSKGHSPWAGLGGVGGGDHFCSVPANALVSFN